jgi:dynein heavy chain
MNSKPGKKKKGSKSGSATAGPTPTAGANLLYSSLMGQLAEHERVLAGPATTTRMAASSSGAARLPPMAPSRSAPALSSSSSVLRFGDTKAAPVRPSPEESAKVADPAAVKAKREIVTSTDVAWAANEVLSQSIGPPEMEASTMAQISEPMLPLSFFSVNDDSLASNDLVERIATGQAAFPIPAAYSDGPGATEQCQVTGFDPLSMNFTVRWDDGTEEDRHRLNVCVEGEDRFLYAKRFAAAHELRRKAEALIRYNLYVNSMPTDEAPVMGADGGEVLRSSAMSKAQTERILRLALSGPLPGSVNAEHLLDEVALDYMTTINKIIFNAARDNLLQDFPDIELPLDVPPPPPPLSGVVETPPHDLMAAFTSFSKNSSFFTSHEAITAMLEVRLECNKQLDVSCFNLDQKQALTLEEFQKMQAVSCDQAQRLLKEDWPVHVAAVLRTNLGSQPERFPLQESTRENFVDTPLHRLLKRVNLMMCDSLRDTMDQELHRYVEFVEHHGDAAVCVKSTNEVELTFEVPYDKEEAPDQWLHAQQLHRAQRPPPMFCIEMLVSDDKTVLNQAAIDAAHAEIEVYWEANPPADGEPRNHEDCPTKPVMPVEGLYFKYGTDIEEYATEVVNTFKRVIDAMSEITQAEMLVMGSLYWSSTPVITSIHSDEPEVQARMVRLHRVAGEEALPPLKDYLAQFTRWIEFANTDVEEHLAALKQKIVKGGGIAGSDDDSDDDDGQLAVDLALLQETIQEHRNAKDEVELCMPRQAIAIGMFDVDCSKVKAMLIEKHDQIIRGLLQSHSHHCQHLSKHLAKAFDELDQKLRERPTDIEQLAEMKEFIEQVPKTLEPLQDDIKKLTQWNGLLEDLYWKVEQEQADRVWKVFGCPGAIGDRIDETIAHLDELQLTFVDSQTTEQAAFLDTLASLQTEADAMKKYDDIKQVNTVAAHVRSLETKLEKATEQALLFNMREGLFGAEVTEYDQIGDVKKQFEPYNKLWATTAEWMRLHNDWTTGDFLEVNAEYVEKEVDKMSNDITKAFKYFKNQGLEACCKIASQIKDQVNSESAPSKQYTRRAFTHLSRDKVECALTVPDTRSWTSCRTYR